MISYKHLGEKHTKKKKLIEILSRYSTDQIPCNPFMNANFVDFMFSRYYRNKNLEKSEIKLAFKLPLYFIAYPAYRYTRGMSYDER